MSNFDDITKMLAKAGIEFEESEDDSSTIITDSGVEFVFKKSGGLKSVMPCSSVEEPVDKRDSWKYFGDDDEQEDD